MNINFRFRNLEDARKAMECLIEREPMPEGLMVHPFKIVGNLCVKNPEYEYAPYELSQITQINELQDFQRAPQARPRPS